MFVLSHTQGGFTVNYPHLLDEACVQLTYILRHAIENDIAEVEVQQVAESEWLTTLAQASRNIQAFQDSCTPGYYNNEGKPTSGGFIGSSYGLGPLAFFKLLAEWREAGDFAGLDLRP
jgi:hypothetical protein